MVHDTGGSSKIIVFNVKSVWNQRRLSSAIFRINLVADGANSIPFSMNVCPVPVSGHIFLFGLVNWRVHCQSAKVHTSIRQAPMSSTIFALPFFVFIGILFHVTRKHQRRKRASKQSWMLTRSTAAHPLLHDIWILAICLAHALIGHCEPSSVT